ncbi:MAG TPA: class I SAM-dependent methyltransferase, partial [Bryobacteraceae bacterium]|nr:class I SAM-dependent methyltransferase [Bryobacteraceae bacterium]
MTRVGVDDGYRIWSRVYDRQPNALLALEERVVIPALPPLAGRVFVDVGAGTGRWTAHASARGARAFGIDLSAEMLAVAARKPRTSGGLLRACMRNIPLASDSADIALCSFALGHIPSPLPVLREMGRIARQVIVTDMHPLAIAAGWKRSFRAERDVFEI